MATSSEQTLFDNEKESYKVHLKITFITFSENLRQEKMNKELLKFKKMNSFVAI